ncbi:hypothetical protein GALL_442850 [mine drainage metagenome]|uniref:Uncharacterized protein n=1 Tax=mine drainage metagenome TaxID=410659 RepID=A0A1J5PTB7_9ZZZZ
MCSTTTGLLSSGHQAASAWASSAARHATRAAAALSSGCRQSASRSACIKLSSPAAGKAQESSALASSADADGIRQKPLSKATAMRSGRGIHCWRDAHSVRFCGAAGIAARKYRCTSMLAACVDTRPGVTLPFARARRTFRSAHCCFAPGVGPCPRTPRHRRPQAPARSGAAATTSSARRCSATSSTAPWRLPRNCRASRPSGVRGRVCA